MKTPNIVLFKYFNSKGTCLHEIAIEDDGALERPGSAITSSKEGAFGLQALIIEVTADVFSIHEARNIRSLSADGGTPIEIRDTLDELEANFGSRSVQWARGIFKHLKMTPPTLQ